MRSHWDEYQALYEEVITATSTERAPWYVVPGRPQVGPGRRGRDLALDVLERLDPQYPPADPALGDLKVT